MLCDARTDCLVAVDERGRAVGTLSTIDVIRAMLGLAPEDHPRGFDADPNDTEPATVRSSSLPALRAAQSMIASEEPIH